LKGEKVDAGAFLLLQGGSCRVTIVINGVMGPPYLTLLTGAPELHLIMTIVGAYLVVEDI